MKKILSLLLIIIMAITVIPTAGAKEKTKTYKSNKCIFTIDKKGNAIVTGSNVKGTGSLADLWDYADNGDYKNWKIPSKLKGHKVTGIDLRKKPYLSVNKIIIPKTVTSIKGLKKAMNAAYRLERDENIDGYEHGMISCAKNSYAEKYAKKNKIDYVVDGKYYCDMSYLEYRGFKFYNSKGKKFNAQFYLEFKDDKIFHRRYTHETQPQSMTFTGKERNLKFTIKRGKQKLKKGRDYTVKYVSNINVGEAFAIIEGKGNFFGTTYVEYYIKPPKCKITSIYKERDVVHVGTDALFDGVVEYSKNKDFSQSKTEELSAGEVHIPLLNFEKGKTYYLRTRSIAEVYYIASGGGRVSGLPYMERNVKYKDMKFTGSYPNKAIFKSSWSEAVKYTVN